MSRFIKLAFAVCLLTSVILTVSCQAKAKKSRTRNGRKCPNACLRKIRQIERRPRLPGPPGPQGSQGPKGDPGPEGSSIRLPTCQPGEYLTSDGTSLRCEQFDVNVICTSSPKQECRIDDKKPGEGASNNERMVKFMIKNMFQTISTDAWDIEVFQAGNSLFFGLSQLGLANFQLYKWLDGSFKKYQELKLNGARNWAPFQIGDDLYFAVANLFANTCPIFRYDKISDRFTNQSDGLECKHTFDLKPFKLNGEQYIAVANQGSGSFVVIWKWNGRRFTKLQDINNTATYVEAFNVDDDTFLAISGSARKGSYVFIYKWDGNRFVLMQSLFVGDRPYEVVAFEAGRDHFLSVATMETSPDEAKKNKLMLMKWTGNKFVSFQNITTHRARRVTIMSSLLMGKKTTYLAVINLVTPEIYYWVEDSSTKFEKLQDIDARSARDVSFFEMSGRMYLLMASRNKIDVFKGELV
ncbi:thrombospondin-type laminin G domain and EAR repeat-containing protein-like [Dendronephthya gigantea]|uniref:thrombospondin-type laminin G domain and EAR repeat-containing protein-like n=1 Tax=Dendronephthya gigantea TaxID=151771 RepID=UPI00106C91E2|nr:thrombospondin-type laminin G domain and EAR repeat-containing protein-like [Dendronephthya gigantea]